MSENARRNAVDQRYSDIKQSLVNFGQVVGRGVYNRCEIGGLSEQAEQELREGGIYLLEGLEAFLTDADRLSVDIEGAKPDVTRLLGHVRALVGGALLVAKHIDTKDTVRQLVRAEQTKAANLGKKTKKIERAESVRDIIEGAARDPVNPRKFANHRGVWEAVKQRLKMPQLDRKTFTNYAEYIDQTRRNDISPD